MHCTQFAIHILYSDTLLNLVALVAQHVPLSKLKFGEMSGAALDALAQRREQIAVDLNKIEKQVRSTHLIADLFRIEANSEPPLITVNTTLLCRYMTPRPRISHRSIQISVPY